MPATLTVTLLTKPSKFAIVGAEPPFCKHPTVKETESKYFDFAPCSVLFNESAVNVEFLFRILSELETIYGVTPMFEALVDLPAVTLGFVGLDIPFVKRCGFNPVRLSITLVP